MRSSLTKTPQTGEFRISPPGAASSGGTYTPISRGFIGLAMSTVLLFLASCIPAAAQNPRSLAFQLEEATIADIHAAFRARTLTCSGLVGLYLERIKAYEDGGPRL